MTKPAYVGLEACDIPTVELPGARLHLVSQDWGGREAPIRPLADIRLMLIELTRGGRIDVPVAAGRTVFLYVVRGEAEIDGTAVPAWNLVELGDEGDGVSIGSAGGALILLGHGAPFGEPIVAHGPFVMNSPEQIVEAIRDYQAGRFGSL